MLALFIQTLGVNPNILVAKDDFDLKEEKVTLFASKRAGDSYVPDKTKLDVKKIVKKELSIFELNLYTHDKQQGKFIPIANGMNLKKNSSLGMSFSQTSRKVMYLYAYAINPWGSVIKIFPDKSSSKAQVYKGMNYEVAKQNKDKMMSFFGTKGTYHIFVYVSNKKIRNLENVKTRSNLPKILRKIKSKSKKSFAVTVKDKFKVYGSSQSLYSNLVGLKDEYAEYFKIKVS